MEAVSFSLSSAAGLLFVDVSVKRESDGARCWGGKQGHMLRETGKEDGYKKIN